jgi:translation initiation factor IF-2
MTMGIFATINQALDFDTATLIAEEYDLKTRPAEVAAPKEEAKPTVLRTLSAAGAPANAQLRPPVVTVLGHVDHGKTTLLDAIRSAKVAAGEAGGITQHIGAYQTDRGGRKITFLDTPGHEAFTAMRARGAQVTDVAILVVAADDGVMPQTKEAINHVRAANVPMVVALNKIDRETADPNRVMRQLADVNVLVEQWGGDTPMVPVSAKKNTGIDELLEMILLVADLAELKASPDAPAVGTVIEAQVDRSRGPVATLLVQNGTLRQNDYIVVEGVYGRVRAMFDDKGNRLNEAGPSTPVLVLGMPSAPNAGGIFKVVADERSAKQAAEDVAAHAQAARTSKTLSLDELYTQMEAGKMHDLNIVLKADVQGSLEPIRNSIEKLSTENLKVRLLHEGLGNISESDVSLALASQAIVIGFHVDADPAARKLANSEGVDIRL